MANIYLVLRGAAEGAWWGAVTGSRGGHAAWIGAAVGTGIGLSPCCGGWSGLTPISARGSSASPSQRSAIRRTPTPS
jgi:hypothetical protein